MKKNNIKGMTAALLGGVGWGMAGVFAQYLSEATGCSAAWICCIKMLMAGMVMLLFSFLKDRVHFLNIFQNKRDMLQLFIFTICGILLCQFTFFETIHLSNSGTAATIQYLCPILILIYVCFKEKRRPKWKEIFCIGLAFFGVITLITHLELHSIVLSPRVVICGLASAVFFAMYTVQPTSLIRKYGVVLINGYALFLSGLLMVLIARPWREVVQLNMGEIISILFIAFGGTMLASAFYQIGVNHIGAQKANLLACIEPVSSVVISALWLHTDFTLMDLIGFICIMTAVVWLSWPSQNK